MKHIILITEYLSNPYKGIYTQTTYYSDGSMETKEIRKGPILFVKSIRVD
jgi:hypothetical protein